MCLTEKQKYEIIIRHEMGLSDTLIARNLGISRSTVIRWIKRYEETETIKRKGGSGRKKSLD